MDATWAQRPPGTLLALLGPTNTGKTHRAIERMLSFQSGMLGLPLRLLAREVYDRITARIGERQVALVTGEEKRIPAEPRYWICTVEAMPTSLPVEFVGVDEIQLAAHPQRGHVFTDRLLNVRGTKETWFMGAETIRPLMEELMPELRVERLPRFSELRSVGALKLGALPTRSAVVTFSSARLYELAERLRQRRGGAAVVMGALSPRARNAQVALYQAGEVDYLVATDAIGMGLNLSLDHVCFADRSKFDGSEQRELDLAELAQIAGRAGRYLNHGTFGSLLPLRDLPERATRAIEQHRFRPLSQLYWRNSELELTSLEALCASLRRPPPSPAFRLMEQAVDHRVLLRLLERGNVAKLLGTPEEVSLLWEVCQVPDFRQIMPEAHALLVEEIYTELLRGGLSSDWMRRHTTPLDNPAGGLDALLSRMAAIRTFTYLAQHEHWVEQAAHFREVTLGIEERLSDVLHERLVERFVDRSKRLSLGPEAERESDRARGTDRTAAAHPFFGKLGALRAQLARGEEGSTKQSSIERLVEASFEDFSVDVDGRIRFEGAVVGQLLAGQSLVTPSVVIVGSGLGAGAESRILRRLRALAKDLVGELVGSIAAEVVRGLSGPARGLAYQLEHQLGTLRSRDARPQLQQLTVLDRVELGKRGVYLGRHAVYLRSSVTPKSLAVRAALLSAFLGRKAPQVAGEPLTQSEPAWDDKSYLALGFLRFHNLAVRVDVAELWWRRLFAAARSGKPWAAAVPELEGLAEADLEQLLAALGFVAREGGLVGLRARPKRRRRRRTPA
jgi:ATP-dependent RNA helicase SUPV3L1/SUV3